MANGGGFSSSAAVLFIAVYCICIRECVYLLSISMGDNHQNQNGEPGMTVRTPATDDNDTDEGGTEGSDSNSDVDTLGLGLNWDEEAARGGALMDTTWSLVSTIASCDGDANSTTTNNNKVTHVLEHKDEPKDDDDQDDITTHQDHGQHAAEDGTADGVILFDEQDGESSEQTSICCTVVAWTGDDLSTATPLKSSGVWLAHRRRW